jgi:L-amino acid N-acyltransferase
VQVRRATEADADAIRAIYNVEVMSSTVTFDIEPRSRADQLRWMEEHSGAYPVVVAAADGGIAGFASISPYRPRPAYSTTVEDSVYVHADNRGLGTGRRLLGEIVALAAEHGFHSVIGRVAGDHEASIRLHRACGFDLVGVEREVGRKFGRWLDVAVMQLML